MQNKILKGKYTEGSRSNRRRRRRRKSPAKQISKHLKKKRERERQRSREGCLYCYKSIIECSNMVARINMKTNYLK